ncbi:MAG TPA: hypothetical protein VK106_02505, partial [Balneolaceae bacterium]|nr:hypothetical protein [Balneolaceae bacterium]
FDSRVQNEQLSETPLTFKDLTIIKKTFLKILVGIYHSRVEYPDDEKSTGDRSTASKEKTDKKEETETKKIKEDKPAEKSIGDYFNS